MKAKLTFMKRAIQDLTYREEEVLRLIAYEFSSKEIAEQLHLSYETIQTYRKNLLRKMDVKNTAGMVRVAFQRGLFVASSASA